MTETQKDSLRKLLKIERQDIANPGKPNKPIQADELLREDEDENTIAKSIVDEIIEETEAETSAACRH